MTWAALLWKKKTHLLEMDVFIMDFLLQKKVETISISCHHQIIKLIVDLPSLPIKSAPQGAGLDDQDGAFHAQ